MATKRIYNATTKKFEEIEDNDMSSNQSISNKRIFNSTTKQFEEVDLQNQLSLPKNKGALLDNFNNTNSFMKILNGKVELNENNLNSNIPIVYYKSNSKINTPYHLLKNKKGTAQEAINKLDIFKEAEAFKDGYDFGEVTKTILSTVGDAVTDIGKGAVQLGQGIGKNLAYGVAQIADWTGNDEYANKIKDKLKNNSDPVMSKVDDWQNKTVDKYSILGDTSDKVLQSVGYTGTLMGLNGFGGNALNNFTMFLSSAGDSITDTLQENPEAENWQVWLRSLTSGGLSVATENLGGILGKNKVFGDIEDKAYQKITSKMLNGAGKFLTRIGIDATSEAVEEFIEYTGNQFIDLGMDKISGLVGSDVKFYKDWNWEELGESMAMAYASTILLNGSINAGSIADIKSNYKKNGQKISTKDAINILAKQIDLESKNNLNKNQINDEVQNQNLQENINPNTDNNVQLENNSKDVYSIAEIEEKYGKDENFIEKNSDIEYNNFESEGDINGIRQNELEERTGGNNTNEIQKSSLGSKENIDFAKEYRETEKRIRKETKLIYTQEELNFVGKIKNKYSKMALVFDDSNTNFGGGVSLIDNNTILFGRQTLNDFGYDFLEGHEISEDMYINYKDKSKYIIDDFIERVQDDEKFGDVFLKYLSTLDKEVADYYIDKPNLIAKEIICDLNGYRNSNIDINDTIFKDLNKDMVKEIQMTLKDLEDKIYNNTNSEKSSFILPVNKEITSKTNNKISDIFPLVEDSQIVPVAKQENIDDSKSPTINYIKEKRSKNKASIKDIKDTLVQKFVNKGHYVDKLAKHTGNKNLTYLYDRTMNTFNEAQISIGDNQVNSKGDVVGKSLIDIFNPSKEANLSKEFDDYLLNKHNISRYAYEKGIYGKEISSAYSQKIVDNYEKKYPQFKEWSKDVSNYNDNNLKDLVENGMISLDVYKKMKSMYGDYVPTYRDIADNISEYLDNSIGGNVIGKATQSNKDILSISESMAEQTLAIKKAIRINNLGIELYKTLGKDSKVFEGIDYDISAIQTLNGNIIEKASKGNNTFIIFVDGKMTQFKISDELYTAFEKDTLENKINNNKVAKTLLTPLEKASKFQRELLTTYNIGFAFSNPIKDFSDALFNTKYSNARFLKNYTKALYNLATNGSWYESYKNSGGTANTYFDYDNGILPTNTKNPIKKFVNKIKNVNEVLEQAPRLAEYISTIEKGGSIDEALYNAAEITINFKRGGDVTKVANKYGANFLNASVQGLDKFYRNLSGQNGWKGYTNIITKATLFQVIPSIINGLLLGDDDDYEDLPEYIKDNYYLFKKGNGEFVRIPKGRVSSIIGGIARRGLEAVEGKEVDWKSIIDTTINQMAPNNPLEDNIVAPIKQAIENKTWYGDDLVPTRLKNVPNSEQYDESIDKLSIFLGKKLKISPYKINYVLDQYSGGIGDILLPMLTSQAENGKDDIVNKVLAPISDKFTVDSIMKNKNISKFYKLSEELTKKSNSINVSDDDVLMNKYINSVKDEISELYKDKREIQNSNLKDSEKYSKVREVQQKINDIAEYALDDYKNINKSENYAEIGGVEYYKRNDEWKKVDDNEKSDSTFLNMTTIEKNEYFNIKNKISGIDKDENDSHEIKIKVGNTIVNSNLTDEVKAHLYGKKYSNEEKINVILDSNIDMSTFIKYDINNFVSDKDENGDTISNSKKRKIISYVNSLEGLSIPQKAILIKSAKSFKYNDYNDEIIDYIYNLGISNEKKNNILKYLDIEV